ncbi:MAG: FIST C-terminal domain-containing protein [Defluviitaleaceae bacterium]|nr:FIST C-terminal domain-containing protein [Defluviitaleaceae bacterium]
MTKTFVISTVEIDDPIIALDEIKSQINLETDLLTNSIGIISCHYEFVISGVAKAVCEALPFDVAGIVASPMSDGTQADSLLLTVMVITSDDTEFIKIVTPSIAENASDIIAQSYKTATNHTGDKPTAIFAFAPFMPQNSGDNYVNVLTDISEGVPVFGSLAVDDTADFSNCFTISNGENHNDKMMMILTYGNFNPKFYMCNISDERVSDESAVVTKSEGHIVKEVNGIPVLEYFDTLGLSQAAETQYAMSMLPFLVDYKDDTPMVAKIFIGLTPENHALFGGIVSEGNDIHIALTDKNDVLMTTGKLVDQILEENPNASGLLVYSCVARAMAMGVEQYSEMELVNEKLANKLPILMSTSGGEMCPTQISDNNAINRFHNNTFVACVF